jgi:N-carbamoylputrescine amidase
MKIAGIQFSCSDSKDKNTDHAFTMMDMAVQQGAAIICFQELFNLPWFPRKRDESAFIYAEDINSHTINTMCEKAHQAGCVVVLPFFEKWEDKYFNSCIVINSDGKAVGTYRKVHVPDIPLWEEKFYFSPGDKGFPIFKTNYGCLGIQISWDNLLPEGSRILALKGADIIVAPTSCAFKSQHIWQTVISANAITNAIFAIRINRTGSEERQDFYGMSFCVNPEGELIGGPTGTGDAILLAEMNVESLAQTRREWPIMKERRPDLYKEVAVSRRVRREKNND